MAQSKAKVVGKVNAPAGKVWDELGAFGNLEALLPDVIKSCKLDTKGTVRTLKIAGVKQPLKERLVKYDEKTRTQSYAIIDEPKTFVPFVNYVSTIKVKESGARSCTVEWSSVFDAKKGQSVADCQTFAKGIYETGIAGARTLCAPKPKKKKTARAKKAARAKKPKK